MLRAIPYGPSSDQVGDLYVPQAPGPAAVVVLIHGGFWRMPYGRDLMEPLAHDLARRGYAVWNVEYRRLGAPGGGWPGELEDVAAAVDALAGLRASHGVDAARVAAVGHSAGGHLALWLAARGRILPGYPGARPRVNVAAAAGQAPVCDLRLAFELGLSRGAVAELLGGSPDEVADRYAQASPAELLPLDVPRAVVHGDADDIVPLAVAGAYVRKAAEAGDRVEFTILPGAGHFEHLDPQGPAWAAVVTFLERTFPVRDPRGVCFPEDGHRGGIVRP